MFFAIRRTASWLTRVCCLWPGRLGGDSAFQASRLVECCVDVRNLLDGTPNPSNNSERYASRLFAICFSPPDMVIR